MGDEESGFLAKAEESLASAESEFAAGRFNSCANRCYYACFQAAISALLRAGISPAGNWGHDFVRARFAGDLINRRHLYPPELRDALPQIFALRQRADYESESVTMKQTERILRRTRAFVRAISQED